jgi:ABC-2 type transport system ATP-binding protein
MELLAKEMPSSMREGRDIIIKLPENDGIAIMSRAVELINDRHAACKELYVKKSTLEDVFLNLTGEKLVKEAA